MKTAYGGLYNDLFNQDRKIYYYVDKDTNVTRVGGDYYQDSKLTYATVPKSGHFMPMDNYQANKNMLDDFIQYGEVRCKDPDTYCRVKIGMCVAMNECSLHGECQETGLCKCDSDHKGADCSYTLIENGAREQVYGH